MLRHYAVCAVKSKLNVNVALFCVLAWLGQRHAKQTNRALHNLVCPHTQPWLPTVNTPLTNPLYFIVAFSHDDVIKWKHFPRYWPFVRGIHRSPVNSPHKGQWRVALIFSLIWAWTNSWANNRDASDLRRHRAHYNVPVMILSLPSLRWYMA